jgi:flagellar motor switch protein FliM
VSGAVASEGAEVAKQLISDEEVAALLEKNPTGEVRPYDLIGTQRITRGRLPALETIHETFARTFRVALFNLLQREPQVTFEGVRTQKAGDYLAGITTPASLDICRLKPLPGNALIVFDPTLVFLMVDTYFGGQGRPLDRTGDRGLTPTEVRFVQLVLRQAASDLGQAWAPVAQVEVELVKHESNPLFASVAAPTDTVREVLTAGIVARSGNGEAWAPSLATHLASAVLEVRAVLSEVEITLGELQRLTPGDVLPIEAPGRVTLYAGDQPLYAGKFGVSRGRNALKILQPLRHRSF